MTTRRWMCVLLAAASVTGARGAEDESTATDDNASLDSEAEIEDSTTGVTDSAIRIGVHAPETIGGIDIRDILGLGGMTQLCWDTVNEQGGSTVAPWR